MSIRKALAFCGVATVAAFGVAAWFAYELDRALAWEGWNH